jgi:hypothetical protein
LAACDAASLSGLSEGTIVRLVVKKDRLEVIAG